MANSYTRVIRGEGGVPGPELLQSQNLLRLYPRDGREPTLATAPGYRRIAELGSRVNGIFRYGEIEDGGKESVLLLVHAGQRLYGFLPDGDGSLIEVSSHLGDAPSRGFRFGAYFYLLDGSDFYRVSVDSSPEGPVISLQTVIGYVPTETVEGEAYEAPSLLSERSKMKWRILSLESYGEGSPGLRFEISDAERREARLVGGEVSGELRVPSFTSIGGIYYRVSSIAPSAFEGNLDLTSVRLGLEVREVGDGAFRACRSLTSFSAPGRTAVLGYSCLAGCERLTSLSVGASLESIRAYATEGCTSLSELLYAGEDFSRVSVGLLGNSPISAITPVCSATIPSFEDRWLRFPLSHSADELISATLDGTRVIEGNAADPGSELYFLAERDGSGCVTAALLYAENPRALYEKELTLEVRTSHSRRQEMKALLSRYPTFKGTADEALRGCTVGTSYDGRIFLGGNPRLPGAVFYSCRRASGEMDAGYFSVYSYFTEGGVGASLIGLLGAPDGLWVFTDESEGVGIYRHVGADTDTPLAPRIYPIQSGHIAEGRFLDAILYRDEAILMTTRGVSAIREIGLGVSRLSPRDEGIAALSGLPVGSRLGKWLGYLAVFSPDGELWLGDGRRIVSTPSGERRPEWWYLSGITGYRGATRVYRYASRLDSAAAALGISLAPTELVGERIPSEVYAEGEASYAYLNQRKVAAVWEGEETGGEALGFSAVLFDGDELLFADRDGTVYRFATDRRGIPPTSALSEYGERELREFYRKNPDYLAPEWYHFDRHPICVRLLSALDDCGHPGEWKSTEVHSTLIFCHAIGRYTVTALCDDGRRFGAELSAGGEVDFSTLPFGALSFDSGELSPTVLSERTKKWHRKQYLIESEGVGTPLELREISYRYAVVGKVKRI